MGATELVNQREPGSYLTQIRERAGIKQAELARKVTWSRAVLSRIESGERPLAPDELAAILTAIGTAQADQLREALEIRTRMELHRRDRRDIWYDAASGRSALAWLRDTFRSLITQTALLVLPRMNEALAVKDESGIRVEAIEDGYDLKGEQIAQSLQPPGLENLAVGFFNAYQDAPDRLRGFLLDRVNGSRESIRTRLSAPSGLRCTTGRCAVIRGERSMTSDPDRYAFTNTHFPSVLLHCRPSPRCTLGRSLAERASLGLLIHLRRQNRMA